MEKISILRVMKKTRPDTRLPQSRVGGQGPYLWSVEHLGRSGLARNPQNAKKVKCDGPTDGPTDGRTDRRMDGPTKRGVESCSTRLKNGPITNFCMWVLKSM